MRIIRFSLGGGYDAVIGRSAINALPDAALSFIRGKKAAVITDSGVPKEHIEACTCALRGAGFDTPVFILPMGEQHKDIASLVSVYGFLYDNGITRADGIIGVGGGSVGDTAGFAAATYLRGVPFISVPTTIISQTDSAYGGKTGVDFRSGKNLIGCFSHPKAVICDVSFLDTLNKKDIVSGMGEIIKYGAIAEPLLLERIGPGADEADIALCADIKRRYVEADELDMGERRILNFGHTFGHAFEAASGYTLPHGQAVAYGMLAICRAGERLGVTDPCSYAAIESACRRAGLDTEWRGLIGDALPLITRDKKSDGSTIEAVFIEAPGKPTRKKLAANELSDAVL